MPVIYVYTLLTTVKALWYVCACVHIQYVYRYILVYTCNMCICEYMRPLGWTLKALWHVCTCVYTCVYMCIYIAYV